MKKIVIGCLGSCFGIVVLGIIVSLVFGIPILDWWKNFFEAKTEEELARQQLTSDWSAPPIDENGHWLPSVVGEYQKNNADTFIQEFGLNAAKMTGRYNLQKNQVDVFWLSEDDVRFSTIVEEIDKTAEASDTRMSISLPYRAFFSWRPPYRELNVWNLRDWVLVVYTEQPDSEVDTFIKRLLTTSGDVTTEDELEIPEIDLGGFDDDLGGSESDTTDESTDQ